MPALTTTFTIHGTLQRVPFAAGCRDTARRTFGEYAGRLQIRVSSSGDEDAAPALDWRWRWTDAGAGIAFDGMGGRCTAGLFFGWFCVRRRRAVRFLRCCALRYAACAAPPAACAGSLLRLATRPSRLLYPDYRAFCRRRRWLVRDTAIVLFNGVFHVAARWTGGISANSFTGPARKEGKSLAHSPSGCCGWLQAFTLDDVPLGTPAYYLTSPYMLMRGV